MSSVNGLDLCSFGRLDDDLTVLDNTPNLVSFNFGAMPLQQTTLILPKNAHLDETMAAALAKTSPGAMFRVKKEPGAADPVPLKKRKEKVCVGSSLTKLLNSICKTSSDPRYSI